LLETNLLCIEPPLLGEKPSQLAQKPMLFSSFI